MGTTTTYTTTLLYIETETGLSPFPIRNVPARVGRDDHESSPADHRWAFLLGKSLVKAWVLSCIWQR